MEDCKPVISQMVWSYSRIKAFEDCPYRWYLRYIQKLKGKDMFFSSYGAFVHQLLEQYYKGVQTPSQLCDHYLQEFKAQVKGAAPSTKIFANYFTGGLAYFKSLHPLPYRPLAVEKRVEFKVNDIPFVGVIDLLGEKNGQLFIVDHKSRNLKPKTTRNPPTKTDIELEQYFRQLYLYSIPIQQQYQQLPHSLCFNCFRTQTFIEEPFNPQAYTQARQWLIQKIASISQATQFPPDMDFFKCKYLCEMQNHCEYYKLSYLPPHQRRWSS